MQAINSFKLCQMFRRLPLFTEVQTVCYKSTKKANENIVDVPTKPKRPQAAFFRYVTDVRPEILAKDPELSQTDIMKAAAEMWKNADENLKAPFVQAYTQDQEQYKVDIEEYNNTLTDEQKSYVQAKKSDETKQKMKRKLKKLAKELGRPKRPATAFGLFISSMQDKRDNIPMVEWIKQLSQQWKIISDTEKQHFTSKAEELRADYKIKLEQWNKKLKENDTDEPDTEDILNLKKVPKKNKPVKSVPPKSQKVGDEN